MPKPRAIHEWFFVRRRFGIAEPMILCINILGLS
jgi:hypothetical protein